MCPISFPDLGPITLFPKASKRLFHFSSMEYLGYVDSSEGLKMDKKRFQQILNWPTQEPSRLLNHSMALQPSTTILLIINLRQSVHAPSSSIKIQFPDPPPNEESLSQFHQLKEALTTSPILLYQSM
ncbi:hypothetical protein O181_129908 [Austropuccinia psidii MF-1]|uniref:Uncharacterized protein n=1 Tax=Austropuccinia psidii MF-1 TaxID=1389203 RepID=A0A9Q3Q995_9BASI|nr:hypothetical protein [Austropuccinia psidii MF-1]